jgi:hypothetical protein
MLSLRSGWRPTFLKAFSKPSEYLKITQSGEIGDCEIVRCFLCYKIVY